MKKFAFALALSLLLPVAASAKSYTLPADGAVAVVTVPDSWETEEIALGVESNSPDEEVYLAIEVISASDVKDGMTAAIKYLADQGVAIQDNSAQQKEIEINGMKTLVTAFNATDSDGPTSVSVSIVIVNNQKLLLLTYWASPAGTDANLSDLNSILTSIKRVGA